MVAKDERLAVMLRGEKADCRAKGIKMDVPNHKPYRNTLNGYFVKKEEDVPYIMFPEPWKDNNKIMQSSIEIFTDVDLSIDVEDLVYCTPREVWERKVKVRNEWDMVLGRIW